MDFASDNTDEEEQKSLAEKLSSLTELSPEQLNALSEYEEKEAIRKQKGKKYSVAQAVFALALITFAILWVPRIPVDGGDENTAKIFSLLFFVFLVNIAVYLNRVGFIGSKERMIIRSRMVAKFDSPEQKQAKLLFYKIFFLIFSVLLLAVGLLIYFS